MGWICVESQNQLIRVIMDGNLVGKRLLGRPLLRWEDVIKKGAEALNGGLDWKERVADRDDGRIGCGTGWS